MRGIGFDLSQGRSPRVVKPKHKIRIAREAFGRRHIFHPVLLPQSASIAERIDPAFSRYASSGQDHDIANVIHLPHEARETEARQ